MKPHVKGPEVRETVIKAVTNLEKIGRESTIHGPLPRLHLLVIDDDPLFRKVIAVIGETRGIAVTACGTLQEIEAVALPDVFDTAIIDYYLDGIRRDYKGIMIARRLGQTPIILVSRRGQCLIDNQVWPATVREFIDKSKGANVILDCALRIKEKEEKAVV